eukprot:m.325391 g.325391  ORF g.325391 m.325391 type:complete len:487 (+) comp55559_c0_seq3:1955-3415(+)
MSDPPALPTALTAASQQLPPFPIPGQDPEAQIRPQLASMPPGTTQPALGSYANLCEPDTIFQCQFTDKKPPYSFSCLIALAIDRAPDKKLTISQIYAWIEGNFPYFKRAQSSWKNSIRHNLSLNKCFRRGTRDEDAEGKGAHWLLDDTYFDVLRRTLEKCSTGGSSTKSCLRRSQGKIKGKMLDKHSGRRSSASELSSTSAAEAPALEPQVWVGAGASATPIRPKNWVGSRSHSFESSTKPSEILQEPNRPSPRKVAARFSAPALNIETKASASMDVRTSDEDVLQDIEEDDEDRDGNSESSGLASSDQRSRHDSFVQLGAASVNSDVHSAAALLARMPTLNQQPAPFPASQSDTLQFRKPHEGSVWQATSVSPSASSPFSSGSQTPTHPMQSQWQVMQSPPLLGYYSPQPRQVMHYQGAVPPAWGFPQPSGGFVVHSMAPPPFAHPQLAFPTWPQMPGTIFGSHPLRPAPLPDDVAFPNFPPSTQ